MESKLRAQPQPSKNTESVFAKTLIRVADCPYHSFSQIRLPAPRIDQSAFFIPRKRIDSKIAAGEVFFNCFCKLNLVGMSIIRIRTVFTKSRNLNRAIISQHRNRSVLYTCRNHRVMRKTAHHILRSCRGRKIDIECWAPEERIAQITANNKTLKTRVFQKTHHGTHRFRYFYAFIRPHESFAPHSPTSSQST